MKELAERVIKCKHWRWMAGMLSLDTGLRFDEFTDMDDWEATIPDLNDPATIGCLLSLVREAWQGQFTVCGEAQLTPEALVKALESAE